MARKKNSALEKAKKYSDFLLYTATGGTMGKPFVRKENIPDEMDFADKRSLLESLLKIAQLEAKDKSEDDGEGEFDRIRREMNASAAAHDEGNDSGKSGAGGRPEDSDSENDGSDLV